MQFDNQKTRNVADVVARILAGESAQQEPQQLDEKLIGNQHKIDANKNNKIDAHDFKLLRSKKKVEEETEELEESHFKVGDEVVCKKSGMEGEVVKVDEPQVGKYYTVKQENGKMVKYAPDELKKEEEDEDEDEDEDKMKSEEVHNKKKDDTPSTSNSVKKPVRNSDGTIQSPISRARELAQQGLKKAMSKEETEIDEAMFPGTKEYEKKFGQSPQQKLKKKGDTVPTSQGDMTKTDKGVAHRRRFTEMLESYTEGGLKYIATLVQEEPDNEEYTKEVEKAKAKDRGENRNDKNIAAGKVDAVKVEEEVELDEELTSDQIQKHKQLASKHRTIAKSSGGDTRVAHQRAANLHAGAVENPWYKKGSSDALSASKKLGVSEEVEELDELSKGTLASYAKKATHDARIKHGIGKDFERISKSSRKPEYKQSAKEWEDKYKSDARRREAGVGKAIDRLAKEEVEQVDEVLDSAGKFMSYATKAAASGLKSAVMGTGKYRKRQAGIQKAVEKAKAKVNEEVEELDELTNKTLTNYETRARFSSDPKHRQGAEQARKKVSDKELRQAKARNPMLKSGPSMSKEETEIAVINADAANGVEMVDIAEREMTDAEMKKREKIVKSMKKGLAGFKQRYGDRAKDVMYATATKQAMKD